MQKLMTLIATLATTLLIADVLPESMRVYPTPQDVKLGAEAMIAKPKTVAIQNINQLVIINQQEIMRNLHTIMTRNIRLLVILITE